MSVLMIEETKKRHKEMWMWIAEETRKSKKIVWKGDFFKKSRTEYFYPKYGCWCCELASQIRNEVFSKNYYDFCPAFSKNYCNFCPAVWGDVPDWCLGEKSLFMQWKRTTEYEEAADLAEKIANLPFKSAFDITPEQAKLLRNKGYGEIYSTEEV